MAKADAGVLDLSGLKPEEIEKLREVLRRDGELQKEVDARQRVVHQELHKMRKVSATAGSDSSSTCVRCHCSLGFLVGRGAVCPQCRKTVCDECQQRGDLVPARYGWVCTYCLLQWQSKCQAGEWFFSSGTTQPSDMLRKLVFKPKKSTGGLSPSHNANRRRSGDSSNGSPKIRRKKKRPSQDVSPRNSHAFVDNSAVLASLTPSEGPVTNGSLIAHPPLSPIPSPGLTRGSEGVLNGDEEMLEISSPALQFPTKTRDRGTPHQTPSPAFRRAAQEAEPASFNAEDSTYARSRHNQADEAHSDRELPMNRPGAADQVPAAEPGIQHDNLAKVRSSSPRAEYTANASVVAASTSYDDQDGGSPPLTTERLKTLRAGTVGVIHDLSSELENAAGSDNDQDPAKRGAAQAPRSHFDEEELTGPRKTISGDEHNFDGEQQPPLQRQSPPKMAILSAVLQDGATSDSQLQGPPVCSHTPEPDAHTDDEPKSSPSSSRSAAHSGASDHDDKDENHIDPSSSPRLRVDSDSSRPRAFSGLQRRQNVKRSRRGRTADRTGSDSSGTSRNSSLAGSTAEPSPAHANTDSADVQDPPLSSAGQGNVSERERARARAVARAHERRSAEQAATAPATDPANSADVTNEQAAGDDGRLISRERSRRVGATRKPRTHSQLQHGDDEKGRKKPELIASRPAVAAKESDDSSEEEESGMDIDSYFASAKTQKAPESSPPALPAARSIAGKRNSQLPTFSRQMSEGGIYSMGVVDSSLHIGGHLRLDLSHSKSLLQVKIVACAGLQPMGAPYCLYAKAYVLPDVGKAGKRETRPVEATADPHFNETLTFNVTSAGLPRRSVSVSLWRLRSGEPHVTFFGGIKVSLAHLQLSAEWQSFDKVLQQEPAAVGVTPIDSGRYSGSLQLSIMCQKAKKRTGDSMCCLQVGVRKGVGISAADPDELADPFVVGVLLPNEENRTKTEVCPQTLEPIWNEPLIFKEVTSKQLPFCVLELGMWDHDLMTSNDFLGAVRLGLAASRREVRGSDLGAVSWRDVTGDEEDAWKEVLSRPGEWIDVVLPLRAISPR